MWSQCKNKQDRLICSFLKQYVALCAANVSVPNWKSSDRAIGKLQATRLQTPPVGWNGPELWRTAACSPCSQHPSFWSVCHSMSPVCPHSLLDANVSEFRGLLVVQTLYFLTERGVYSVSSTAFSEPCLTHPLYILTPRYWCPNRGQYAPHIL